MKQQKNKSLNPKKEQSKFKPNERTTACERGTTTTRKQQQQHRFQRGGEKKRSRSPPEEACKASVDVGISLLLVSQPRRPISSSVCVRLCLCAHAVPDPRLGANASLTALGLRMLLLQAECGATKRPCLLSSPVFRRCLEARIQTPHYSVHANDMRLPPVEEPSVALFETGMKAAATSGFFFCNVKVTESRRIPISWVFCQ